MIPRWITTAFPLYLTAPIALLLIRSFGDLWLNTPLPTGATMQWYVEVAAEPGFRRAYSASLFVAVMARLACVTIGLPLAPDIGAALREIAWLASRVGA